MLISLTIKNFAIIEHQEINFSEGLNIISGETGSGKSLVLQALEILLGKKPKTDVLRKGADSWEIEAHFDLSEISKESFESLPEIAQDKDLVLIRTQGKNTRGKIFINGRTGSLSLLKEISEKLINICGQGYNNKLLDEKHHLELLDEYAEVRDIFSNYSDSFAIYSSIKNKYEGLLKAQEDKERRVAELQFIIEELSEKNIKPGLRAEYDEFITKSNVVYETVKNVSKIEDSLNNSSGIFSLILNIQKELTKISKLDNRYEFLNNFLDTADNALQDFEKEIKKLSTTSNFNPRELEEAKVALSELARLERKFRTDDSGLSRLLSDATNELETLEGSETLTALKKDLDKHFEVCKNKAQVLSLKRKDSSAALKKEVEKELKELNMKDAELGLVFKEKELSTNGQDDFEFHISTNKGEAKKSLGVIASGGELSRIMLVLKKALRDTSGVNVLIFDEIDTGVSGSVARAIGEKLKSISLGCQVVCITHLAQVASLGDRHLLIEKKSGKRTQTIIREIVGDDQLGEIARMISGHKVTKASKESAKELLGW